MIGDSAGCDGLAGDVTRVARAAGFDDVGFCDAVAYPEMQRLAEWVGLGYHAGMTFLRKSIAARMDPGNVLPGARTAVVVAMSCLAEGVRGPGHGAGYPGPGSRFALYSLGRSYHEVMASGLRQVVALLEGRGFRAVAHVDTGPVMEKLLAARAGLGVIGDNGLLQHPVLGSWVCLGVVLTDARLEPSRSSAGYPTGCAHCGACVAACPNAALLGGGLLDARRCISYWTIEARGRLRPWQRKLMRASVYGCDECQRVCPGNRAAWDRLPERLGPRHWLDRMGLPALSRLEPGELDELACGTVIARLGHKKLLRNVRAAMEWEAGLERGTRRPAA
jgi:epoxyqueuosine reductase